MNEQEEIREEAIGVMADRIEQDGEHTARGAFLLAQSLYDDYLVPTLHSKNVVIKVDRELPQIIDDEIERINRICKTHRDKIEKSYYDAQIELINDYGYEAVEPLVKE